MHNALHTVAVIIVGGPIPVPVRVLGLVLVLFPLRPRSQGIVAYAPSVVSVW